VSSSGEPRNSASSSDIHPVSQKARKAWCVYLTRGDDRPFVVLPDLRDDRRLEPATILNWCETLDLPKEDFGL